MQSSLMPLSGVLAVICVAGFVSSRPPQPRNEQGKVANELELLRDDPLIPPIGIGLHDTSADSRAHFHPHGEKVCASGCAASNHPTETLTVEEFHRLVDRFNVVPTDDLSAKRQRAAFESLLYFGPQTVRMLARFPNSVLGTNRLRLTEQLEVTHARISIRVVDEFGATRSWLPPTRVPLDRRHVFDMETHQLQPHVASGTVKRVGVDRLWTRL